ncbi:short chain dehydrogenase sirQ [Trichoderma asperellum]|uniref:Short chain dehydrogenase sirQ n=1 Tax=Trichoderma asperellum TaxID=101201 RepID=A0A6V8QTM5_TRIAP|nr:short chain dehydrogenase sirQ [Trichoderma asperellum]
MAGVKSNELQALVFGASGITGWAITNAALSYPTPTTFKRVVGLTNRPLSVKEAALPQDPRLHLYPGLDLSQDSQTITEYLSKIDNIGETTHVYFASYVHRGWGVEDSEKRKKENVDFIANAVAAVENICPKLQFWTFPTGGKWYGLEFGDEVKRELPLRESAPRVPSPHGDHIFYYPQVDTLAKLSEGKNWNFADIRPDAIIGFVPNHNAMNLAEPIGLYLSLWKSLSPSAEVPFPGTEKGWTRFHSDISSSQLARFHIYVSLNSEKTAGKAFNIADVDAGTTWQDTWPGIAAYFGLKGVGPVAEGELSGYKWVESQKEKWDTWTEENGLRPKVLEQTGWDFMTIVTGTYSERDRNFDLTEARRIGFTDKPDHIKSYHVVFDKMRAEKILP